MSGPKEDEAGRSPEEGEARRSPEEGEARRSLDEFDRAGGTFDGDTYLYLHEDVRRELGDDPDGARRHWRFIGHAQDRYGPGLPRRRPRRSDPRRLAARPFGLTVWGPFRAVSGLGTAARNLAEAVRRSGVPHEFRPYDVDTGHPRLADPAERTRPARFRANLVLANADQIRNVAALYDDAMFDDAYTIAVWAWELAAFRPDWHAASALVDEVWTNSRFELAALAGSSLRMPIHLMPLPVPLRDGGDAARARGRALFGIADDAFAVLCPFDPGSTEARKNPAAAIRAFRRAFGTDARRVLVIKHHGGDPSLRDRLLRAAGAGGNVRLIGARLDEEEMALLQAASDIVVSPHRSEGFGLNIAEMLATGRSAVATDYSGSRDFLDELTGFPVRHRLVPVGRRAGPYLADAVWAEPDAEDLVRQLRLAADHPDERSRRAERGRARMLNEFSPAAIGARMRQRLAALGLDRAAPPPLAIARQAGASTERFVPARRPATLQLPDRLPLFTVALDADRADRDPIVRAMRAQSYPFWELLLHRRAGWPAPEDADRRDALRPEGDLRIRLVDRPTGRDEPDGGVGIPLALPPPGDTPPDGDWLLRAARRGAAVPAESPALPPGTALSVRAPSRPILDAIGPIRRDGALDLALSGPHAGFRELARRTLRGDTAEHVVLLEGPALRFDDADWLAHLAQPPEGGAVGLTPDGVDGWPGLVTTRAVLRRVAALAPDPDGADDAPSAFRRLGIPVRPAVLRARPTGDDEEPGTGRGAAPIAIAGAAHRDLVRRSGLFDDEHYAHGAPDVVARGGDLLGHYCDHGWRENRSPNFYFDPVWYRRREMAADESDALDPLVHWIRHRRRGARPSPLFDPAFVRSTLHLEPEADPLAAFLRRRRDDDVAPVPGFDAAHYRRTRRDMLYRRTDPFEHYVRHGAAEGANPSASFDTAFYRARHLPGAAFRRVNPLLHWIDNADRPGIVTSAAAALRTRMELARDRGEAAIDVDFSWCDGLPRSVDTLRALLADPGLDAVPFRLVLRNEALASRPGVPSRTRALLRAPYDDPDEDDDICARLAECLADRRALRDRSGAPMLGVALGTAGEPVLRWAERLAGRLRDRHDIAAVIVPFDALSRG